MCGFLVHSLIPSAPAKPAVTAGLPWVPSVRFHLKDGHFARDTKYLRSSCTCLRRVVALWDC